MDNERKLNGATVGLVVILLILLIGGIYTWKSKVKKGVSRDQVLAPITVEDSEELEAILRDLGTADTESAVDVDSLQ